MQSKFHRTIILRFSLIAFCLSFSFKAHSDCGDNLISAKKLYEEGKLDDAINLILPCSQTESAVQWQAYKLLTKAYLAKQDDINARNAAVRMIELHPTYEVNPRYDSKGFINLLKSIDVIPKLSFGLTIMYGPNITLPRVTKLYTPAIYDKTYSNKGGFQLGLVAGYNINLNHGFGFNMIYNVKNYQVNYDWSGNSYDISESLRYIDFPLMYRYSFSTNKPVRFSILAGPYASVLVNSHNNIIAKNEAVSSELPHYGSNVRRKKLAYGGLIGLGLNIKSKKGHFSLETRYSRSISNITEESSRYDNSLLMYDFVYLDDDIQLDYLSLSVGYHFYINYKVPK